MYLVLVDFHIFMSAIAFFLMASWAILAWFGERFFPMKRGTRIIYISHQALVGLTGISGMASVAFSAWRGMLFPYLGVLSVAVCSVAGARIKRVFGVTEARRNRRLVVAVQVVVYLLTLLLMIAKPF